MTYADAHPDEVRILMALHQSKPLGNQYVLRWFLFYLGVRLMQDIVYKIQDLRRLDWNDNSRSSLGTPGCFLKTYEHDGAKRIYYKMSNYDSYRGVFGHESVNELIVSRVLDVLGIEHVRYRLVHALVEVDHKEFETWLCTSRNFKKSGEQKTALDAFYDIMKMEKETPVQFIDRMGWSTQICQMMVVDYLICNRDRHGANVEVLENEIGEIRLAPLFDHGLSLLFSCYDDIQQIREFDVMKDRPVNNFFYTKSLEENLMFVPANIELHPIKEEDRAYILHGVERILSQEHIEKIWEMLYGRWKRYEEIQYQK
ncbi:MAG: hypothetical protein PUG70_04145 [Lachnospiraceae bacterium]|nr:hypothetical protein [Lachnospiraceae bacterium]MDY5521558.1 hypothetical protein [Agathobacter sp.]